MAFRVLVAALAALFVAGCHGAVHRLPEIGAADIEAARLDLEAPGPDEALRWMWEWQAGRTLRRAARRVQAAGVAVCREIGLAACDWRYVFVPDNTFNAVASADGEIRINLGVAMRRISEEEICLLIAHEMGHHAASHLETDDRFRRLGWAIGWHIGHLIDVFSGFGGGRGGRFTGWGVAYGEWIGGLLWSRQREREADTIAVLIVHRAGLDLAKARGLGLRLAHEDARIESGPFDTHPRGAERLAVVDRAIAMVRESGGRLPPRAVWPLASPLAWPPARPLAGPAAAVPGEGPAAVPVEGQTGVLAP